MFQEANHPFLADFIEERSDVGVQYIVHLLADDPDTERIQRIMRAAFRPKPIREPEEVYLVDRVQAAWPPPVGRFCPPGPRPRADAAVRPVWVYRPAGSVAPDTLPVGPDRANPRCCSRGLPRNPSTSVDPHPARRPP